MSAMLMRRSSSRNAFERVAHVNHALLDNRKIDSRTEAGPKSFHHVGAVETDTQLEAGHTGLRHFDRGSADSELVADEGVVFQKTFGREILAEIPPGEFAVRQLLAPVVVVFGGIGVDGLVLAAVNGEVGLMVAIEIHAAEQARAGHGRFENAGEHVAGPRASRTVRGRPTLSEMIFMACNPGPRRR